MADELQFRKVSDLEELEVLDGTELIPIISEGKMKAVSQENAKFGGGGSTTFYVSSTSAADIDSSIKVYKDPEFTEEVTAQEAYDAVTSGLVWLAEANSRGPIISGLVCYYSWWDSSWASEDPTNVIGITLGIASEPSLVTIGQQQVS